MPRLYQRFSLVCSWRRQHFSYPTGQPTRCRILPRKRGNPAPPVVGSYGPRDYAVDYALVNLDKFAGKTKVMPDAFIAPTGSDVTPAFREYLRPLLGLGLPQPARLRGGAIAKVLKR